MGQSMQFYACPESTVEQLEEVDLDDFHDLIDEIQTGNFCPEYAWNILFFLLDAMGETHFDDDEFQILDEEGEICDNPDCVLEGEPLENGPDFCQLLDADSVGYAAAVLKTFTVEHLRKRFDSDCYKEAVSKGEIYRHSHEFEEVEAVYLEMREFFIKAAERGDVVVYYFI